MRCFKVGGIRFLRLGRYQLSFCRCRVKPARRQFPAAFAAYYAR